MVRRWDPESTESAKFSFGPLIMHVSWRNILSLVIAGINNTSLSTEELSF